MMENANGRFICPNCGELTPLISKKDKLKNKIEHIYYECQARKGKITICFTDKKIRKLIKKQQDNVCEPKITELAEKINLLMDELRTQIEHS